jgi:heat shock protein HslJ
MNASPKSLLLWLFLALPVACAKAPPPALPPQPTPAGQAPVVTSTALPVGVVEVTWRWDSLVTPTETVKPERPERYTIRFERTGRVAVRSDCNRGGGSYTLLPDSRLTLGPIALTRMACPQGSLSDRFAGDVGRATSYFVRDGALFLEMPADSGTLRFTREP